MTSVCYSNFVYFYVFNGLKAIAYKDGAKPYPAKDLVLAFVAGECAVCCLRVRYRRMELVMIIIVLMVGNLITNLVEGAACLRLRQRAEISVYICRF